MTEILWIRGKTPNIQLFNLYFSASDSHLILISLPMNNSRVFPEISCVWSDIFGTFVQMAGPYLYPCKIEYSLICAGKTDFNTSNPYIHVTTL